MHHTQFIPRDVLMDTFWPDADPESARNSLNVALHSLRQALHSITLLPVILFENEGYRLNQDMQVWMDVEEFETRLQNSQRLESAGQINLALAELEAATCLYQGDFLSDDPYEEWTVINRERLCLAYLDALYLLCCHYYQLSKYTACAALCHRILEKDVFREDVHCLLMRCYASQNQFHLVHRQYQTLVEALRKELDVEPATTTKELYEQLRHRI